MKFNYGNFHLKYDMEGEIKIGTGIVQVNDLFNGLPAFMKQADCIFVDPPCSKGNLKSFYTKNESILKSDFDNFNKHLFKSIQEIKPSRVFIEVFKSNKSSIEDFVKSEFPNSSTTLSYYYHDKNKKCWIIEGSTSSLVDLPYQDEQSIIEHICKNVMFNCIADPCMGRGLVGYFANKYNKKFVGTELNKKRLAVLLERINNGKL